MTPFAGGEKAAQTGDFPVPLGQSSVDSGSIPGGNMGSLCLTSNPIYQTIFY